MISVQVGKKILKEQRSLWISINAGFILWGLAAIFFV